MVIVMRVDEVHSGLKILRGYEYQFLIDIFGTLMSRAGVINNPQMSVTTKIDVHSKFTTPIHLILVSKVIQELALTFEYTALNPRYSHHD